MDNIMKYEITDSQQLSLFMKCCEIDESLVIGEVTEHLEKLPTPDIGADHYFADGQYMRSSSFPAGTFIVGEKHRYSSINIFLTGSATVYNGKDEPMSLIKAPAVWVSQPGVQKMALFHEDTTWMNPFPSKLTELEELHNIMYIRKETKETL